MNTKGRHRVPKLPTGSKPIVPAPTKPLPKNVIEVDFKRERTPKHEALPDPLLGLGLTCVIIFVDFSNRKKIGHVAS